ncbi:MAG TPA: flagellar basal body L-ring protein FlgH [Bacteriovoracaceae bacterium]|nr:flagellar basal body L-ring protein FlgH [Bacteriovoracaceae bacterium]
MKLFLLSLLLLQVSCVSFVNRIHKQIDREERKESGQRAPEKQDRFAAYRNRDRFRPEEDKRPIKNPISYSLGGAAGQGSPQRRDGKRVQAEDFVDDTNNGSLWANQGSSSSLFTYQNDKHAGDIVIINVLENLRNQISAELKRTFPDRPRKPKEGDKPVKGEEKVAAASPLQAALDNEVDIKVYDKISGTVTEDISKDYILLKGRKEVIFKREKRSVEVQALVSRKDIMENDYVNSDKMLESRVFILKENQ